MFVTLSYLSQLLPKGPEKLKHNELIRLAIQISNDISIYYEINGYHCSNIK